MFRFTIRDLLWLTVGGRLSSNAGDEINPHKLFALSCG